MNDIISAPPADTAPLTRKRLPNRRGHMLLDFEADGFWYTAGLGFLEDGRLAEVFLNASKIGTPTRLLLAIVPWSHRSRFSMAYHPIQFAMP
jgi:hypothetical protein